MKVLVIAEDYTVPNEKVALHYVHSRNKYYKENSIDVDVLSFRAKKNYSIDGINVYTQSSAVKLLENSDYDVLVSHAPNIRNHLRFINKHEDSFGQIVFFFHGHEVLKVSEIYPKPYDYNKSIKKSLKNTFQNTYDYLKLFIWRKEIPKIAHKSQFVFVSEWMLEKFLEFVKVDLSVLEGKYHIIPNCVGAEFEKVHFNNNTMKDYDFITIRNNLDGSKYGIDIVNKIAKNCQDKRFLVIGRGNFFKHYKKAENITFIETNLNHKQVLEYLDKSRCALLPTRADSQGVMACEVATYGMPLITSKIEICQEIFKKFDNVALIDNSDFKVNLKETLKNLETKYTVKKNNEYFASQTVSQEVSLLKRFDKN